MKVKPLAKGLLTFVPGIDRVLPTRVTDGAGSPRDAANYSYGVWLKHLTLLWANGMRSLPGTVAELGPGPSLGVGLAAVLCGADTYYALDVVRYSDPAFNMSVLDELIALVESRAPRPTKGWPDFDEYLGGSLFPSHILSDEVLDAALSETRISAIRRAIAGQGPTGGDVAIAYMVPWSDRNVIEGDSVDVLLSQSVLEHVVDLDCTCRAAHAWLRPGGMMSHHIDFTSHGLSEAWNGHWAYSELQWKLIRGKRTYLINRQPYSVHERLMGESGFDIVCGLRRHETNGVRRSDLSSRWQGISDDDLTCLEAFIQAQKRPA